MPQNDLPSSQDSLSQADRNTNEFSGYDGALGQAGVRELGASGTTMPSGEILARPGDMTVVSPPPSGFREIYIGCSWNVQKTPLPGIFGWLGLKRSRKIDVDLGCLYNLADGTRGGLQALGDDDGSFDAPPYVWLSHDERTGARPGDDEFIRLNGAHWPAFARVLVYAYIYAGADDFSSVRPVVTLRVAGQAPVHIMPKMKRPDLGVCAVALLEQVRGGIKITNLTEYFPGQPEMDRAYGFGVPWQDGAK